MNFKKNDAVMFTSIAKFANGDKIPAKYFDTILYVTNVKENGDILVATQKDAKAFGIVKEEALFHIVNGVNPNFNSYTIRTIGEAVAYTKPDGKMIKTANIPAERYFTIIDEKDGYGCLKSGLGWIALDTVSKLD